MGVRKRLSQLITGVGMALGLAAAAGFVALMWPDIDWYGSKALRAVGGTLVTAVLIAVGVSWPFLWFADRIFAKQDNNPRSPSDSIPFSKNESESRKSARPKT
jgi:hypothetical protein